MGDFVGVEALPSPELPHLDPFLVLHHAGTTLAPGTDAAQAGVPPHPHRGFSPVSLIFSGAVRHRDSAGNDSIIRAGGTQWMAAGAGVVHAERPAPDFAALGGELEVIQLWVNSPARHKLDPPQYWGLDAEHTPSVAAGPGVDLGVVAGTHAGLTAPIPTQSALAVLRGTLAAGAAYDFAVPAGANAAVYVLSGQLQVNGQPVAARQLAADTRQTGSTLSLQAVADARVVLLWGQPLGEPIAAYGPFVMNTADEIRQAMRDYGNGRMGTLDA